MFSCYSRFFSIFVKNAFLFNRGAGKPRRPNMALACVMWLPAFFSLEVYCHYGAVGWHKLHHRLLKKLFYTSNFKRLDGHVDVPFSLSFFLLNQFCFCWTVAKVWDAELTEDCLCVRLCTSGHCVRWNGAEASQSGHVQSKSAGDGGIADRFRVHAQSSTGGTAYLSCQLTSTIRLISTDILTIFGSQYVQLTWDHASFCCWVSLIRVIVWCISVVVFYCIVSDEIVQLDALQMQRDYNICAIMRVPFLCVCSR